jgi:hypothetical protein
MLCVDVCFVTSMIFCVRVCCLRVVISVVFVVCRRDFADRWLAVRSSCVSARVSSLQIMKRRLSQIDTPSLSLQDSGEKTIVPTKTMLEPGDACTEQQQQQHHLFDNRPYMTQFDMLAVFAIAELAAARSNVDDDNNSVAVQSNGEPLRVRGFFPHVFRLFYCTRILVIFRVATLSAEVTQIYASSLPHTARGAGASAIAIRFPALV